MLNNELVFQIINKYHSNYLLPLSAKYEAETWNAAMREAWKHLSYKNFYQQKISESMSRCFPKHVDALHENEMVELLTLQNIILERIQTYFQARNDADGIDWGAARTHLQKFLDCLGPFHSQQKTATGQDQNELFNDIQDSFSTERQQCLS